MSGVSDAPRSNPSDADQDARLAAFYPKCDLDLSRFGKSFTRSDWFRVWCRTHKKQHYPGRSNRNE